MKKHMSYAIFAALLLLPCMPVSAQETPAAVYKAGSPAIRLSGVIASVTDNDCSAADPQYDDSGWIKTPLPANLVSIFPGKKGIFWYRFRINAGEILPRKTYALQLGRVSGTVSVYFNGREIFCGNSTLCNTGASDRIRIYTVPASYISTGINVIAVRIESSSSLSAGITDIQTAFGNYSEITQAYYEAELRHLAFIMMYLLTGIFFLMFILFSRREVPFHYFGLFCIAFAVYFFCRLDIKYQVADLYLFYYRTGRLALYSAFPIYLSFVTKMYREKRGILHYASYISAALCIAMFMLTRNQDTWHYINTLFGYPSLILPVSIIIYYFAKYSRRSRGARILLGSMIFGVCILLFDVIISGYSRPGLFTGISSAVSVYGFAIVFFAISFVIFNMIFKLSAEFQIKSYSLQLAIKERESAMRTIDFAYEEALNRLGITAELRDPETGAHIKRVSHFSKLTAQKLGLPADVVNKIYLAAPMHDVGKVGVPDRVLFKKGPLDREEWDLMKAHTIIGGRIFANAKSPVLICAAEIALSHHEKFGGGGYPHNLSGEQIPLSGRIMAISDIYDALRTRRPYKPEIPHDKVVDIILRGDGRTNPGDFDPAVLDVFRQHHMLFNEIYLNYQD